MFVATSYTEHTWLFLELLRTWNVNSQCMHAYLHTCCHPSVPWVNLRMSDSRHSGTRANRQNAFSRSLGRILIVSEKMSRLEVPGSCIHALKPSGSSGCCLFACNSQVMHGVTLGYSRGWSMLNLLQPSVLYQPCTHRQTCGLSLLAQTDKQWLVQTDRQWLVQAWQTMTRTGVSLLRMSGKKNKRWWATDMH